MPRKLNLDELNKEYNGKTFNKLTILDVYKDDIKKRYFVKCICECGNTCNKQLDKLISGHTKSCGCYKFTEEYSELRKKWAIDNQDKIKSRSEKFKQWCKDNPDKVKEKTEKRLHTYAENPEILQRQIANRKITFKNNPDIQTTINNKIIQFYKDSPDRRKALSDACKQSYINNPERKHEISEKLKLYYSDESKRKEISDKVKSFCENNPEFLKNQAELHKQWFLDNRKKVIAQGIELSQKFKDNRLDVLTDSYALFEITHPSQTNDLLSGNIKVTDNILTKCPICGNYSEHIFGNVWRLYDKKFRTGYAPMCDKCRSSLTTSHYEIEIANFISTFYSEQAIKNDRTILNGKELDLYYPNKKIAIEFNGDYWHSEKHKENKYHYNKFKKCLEKDIILVNIFESEWNAHKDSIKEYLIDLFNNKENNLTFIDESTINNNYPLPREVEFNYSYNESFYTVSDNKIYTCGFSTR